MSLQTDQRDRGAVLHFLWGTLPRCLSPRSLAEPRSGLPVPSLFISLVSRPRAEEGAQGRVANSRAAQRHPALRWGGGPALLFPPTHGAAGAGEGAGRQDGKVGPRTLPLGPSQPCRLLCGPSFSVQPRATPTLLRAWGPDRAHWPRRPGVHLESGRRRLPCDHSYAAFDAGAGTPPTLKPPVPSAPGHTSLVPPWASPLCLGHLVHQARRPQEFLLAVPSPQRRLPPVLSTEPWTQNQPLTVQTAGRHPVLNLWEFQLTASFPSWVP